MNVIGALLMVAGVVFLTAGAIGYVRLPDFYTRMHAIGKSDTLGILLTLLGVACLAGAFLVSLKLVLAAVFVFIANPTATHALARAARLSGLTPWTKQSKA